MEGNRFEEGDGADTPPEAEQERTPDNNRRRDLLKGGVAGSVLFTLSGRPAWANNCSESGRMSGNLSSGHEPCNGGEGCSPGFWTQAGWDQWHEELSKQALFGEVFRVDPFGATLGDVILRQARPEDDFTDDPEWGGRYADKLKDWGRQVVAALQNAASYVDFDLTLLELEDKVYTDYQQALYQGTAQDAREIIVRSQEELDAMNNQGCPLDAGFSRSMGAWRN